MADEGFKRKLTAILSADVIGYSRLMRDDEEATVRDIAAHRVLIFDIIKQHNGRVVDSPGDNILAEFASVVDAVNGAIKIQQAIKKKNTDTPEDRRMEFRIGINLGDVIEEEKRIYGDGVNIAARVEGLAAASGIAISGTVYEHIKEKLSLGYHYLGEQDVKNISEPVRVYRLLTELADAGKLIGEKRPKSNKLKWTALTAIALIVLVFGAFVIWNYYYRPSFEPASIEKMAFPLPEKPSIAVLPFDNLSGDPEQDYISDGLTDNIITSLSQIPEMFVIARNSVFTYKGKPVKVKQVSEELGVKYVLEGSIQRSGDRLRVNAQLIDAFKGHHLWAERYDRELKELFKLQDEITIKVVNALQVKLVLGERTWIATNNLDAWRHVVKGMRLFDLFTKEDNRKAIEHFEQATKLDSGYAHAWEWLAWVHLTDGYWGWSESPEKSIKKSLEIYQKTSEGWSPEGRPLFLSQMHVFQKQLEKAIIEGEKALAFNPNSSRCHYLLASSLSLAARPKEAIVHLKKAMRLEPYYPPFFLRALGLCYDQSGQYEKALTTHKILLEHALKGGYSLKSAHQRLASAYARLGRMGEARTHAEELLKIDPDFSVGRWRKQPVLSMFKDQEWLDSYAEMLRKAGLPEHPPLKLPDKPSIAVLAFDNLSGDPEQEYFSDGIAENIITALSKVSELFVIARNSSFTYKGKPVKVQQISRELGVQYVLEGSVQKPGDRVRITAQLIDAKNGRHLWAENYDRDFEDILEIQDEITMKIVTSLRIQLSEGEQARIFEKQSKNIDVYLKIAQAVSLFRDGTEKSLHRFGQLGQEIVDIDPEISAGYRILGWYNWGLAMRGISPRESMKKSFKFAQKALTRDESESLSHGLLGSIYLLMRKYEKAIESGKRAVELDPNGAQVHALLGSTFGYAGHLDEGIAHLKQAIRLNPFPPYWYYFNLGRIYRQKGQYENALTEIKKSHQRNPDSYISYLGLAIIYVMLERQEEAEAAAKKVIELNPKFSIARDSKGWPYKPADLKIVVDAMSKAGLPE